MVPVRTGAGLPGSGIGHSVTGAENVSHTWLFSLCPTWKGWLLSTPAGTLGPAFGPPASCQKGTKSEPTPSHTALCLLMRFSNQHKDGAGAEVWERGSSEEAMSAPSATACPCGRTNPLLPSPNTKTAVSGREGRTWSGCFLSTHNELFPKSTTVQRLLLTGIPVLESACPCTSPKKRTSRSLSIERKVA